MTHYLGNRLLLTCHGTDESMLTARYVSQMFPPDTTRVVVFHVTKVIPEAFEDMEPSLYARAARRSAQAWEEAQKAALEKQMEGIRQVFREAGYPEDSIILKIQEKKVGVARDIVAEAATGYDAVVVGRHGTNPIMELFMGDVAIKLLGALTTVPVLLTSGGEAKRKALIAVDGTASSLDLVDRVGTAFRGADYEFTLFHVVRSLTNEQVIPGVPTALKDDANYLIEEHLKRINVYMDELKAQLSIQGYDANKIATRVITSSNSRAWSIIEEAERGEYGLIAVGRRGSKEKKEFPIGPVANRICQMARKQSVWVVA